ncbi:hypothetical protein C5167_028436 [Papaver somniferum]|nr:hypothetical protein C5167_028436 [Papaver somniferum]
MKNLESLLRATDDSDFIKTLAGDQHREEIQLWAHNWMPTVSNTLKTVDEVFDPQTRVWNFRLVWSFTSNGILTLKTLPKAKPRKERKSTSKDRQDYVRPYARGAISVYNESRDPNQSENGGFVTGTLSLRYGTNAKTDSIDPGYVWVVIECKYSCFYMDTLEGVAKPECVALDPEYLRQIQSKLHPVQF